MIDDQTIIGGLVAFGVISAMVFLAVYPWPPKHYRIVQDGFGRYRVEGLYGILWWTVEIPHIIYTNQKVQASFRFLYEAQLCLKELIDNDAARKIKPKVIERS